MSGEGPSGAGLFSPGVERALRTAFEAHEGQTRKGDPIPYVTHSVHVALILARAGADEITLQAGLLHDVVEDCPGWTAERIEELFGSEVAGAVAAVTETKGQSWEQRKQAALDHVPHMDERAVALKAADKTHNMRSLTAKLDAATPEVAWKPFSRGPEATIDYAERLVAALRARLAEFPKLASLSEDLQGAYDALEAHRPKGE